jgi:hypothetical protein
MLKSKSRSQNPKNNSEAFPAAAVIENSDCNGNARGFTEDCCFLSFLGSCVLYNGRYGIIYVCRKLPGIFRK